jgi:hypothetical protein
MANEEHLAILRQGVVVWNRWREANPDVEPDLTEADLHLTNLLGANFRLTRLVGANLYNAGLSRTNLGRADLSAADLTGANLSGATLTGAIFTGANLNRVRLIGANLTEANLLMANFIGADLTGANLTRASLNGTLFANTDLSTVIGLDTVWHYGPSEIGINTLYMSHGNIPEVFLRGCGVADAHIEYLPSLLGAIEPIQFYSCFISYSTKDEAFARRLYERMQAAHLRVWFASDDIKGDDKLHEQIERAIQLHDRLLLVLSKHSLASAWVQLELRRARRAELTSGRRKLFLIRLMDFEALQEWECHDSRTGGDLAEEVRQYFIPDFSDWKNHDAFESSFSKLMRDLTDEKLIKTRA